MRSIFCDRPCTVWSKPTRLSAGVSARSASRTSARPRSTPAIVDAVGAGMAFVVDARRQRPDLGFQRLDRLPRHGFLEHHADLGEIVAQGLDRGVDAAGPHGVDAGVDLAELLLEVGQALGRRARQVHRRRGGAAVEHALARFDLGQRLVDRSRRADGGGPACAVEPRHGAVDRAHRRSLRMRATRQAVDLAVEPRQGVGDQRGVVAADRAAARLACGRWLRWSTWRASASSRALTSEKLDSRRVGGQSQSRRQ